MANERQRRFYQKHKAAKEPKAKMMDFEKKLSRINTLKKYYKNNKEKIANRKRLWRTSNPNIYRLYCIKRRFLKKANKQFKVTAKDIVRAINRQQHCCFWCRKNMVDFHVDHVIPLSKGGKDSIGNIVLSCPLCNRSKSDKLPIVFRILNNIKF